MASIIVCSFALRYLTPEGRPPTTLFDQLWSWFSVLWLSALLPGTVGLVGTLLYCHPTTLDREQAINRTICWRIVTAGKNIGIVLSTVRRCQREMAKTPLAPYIIEIVMDDGDSVCLLPTDDVDVRTIIVPNDYKTPNHSRFKARALHYALFHSTIPETCWIVHLDEETQPTPSAIKGICEFIRQEEQSRALRMGQGAILYHREWETHPFLTLADNVRTGDDFARFYFQHRLGITLFGLHGSFVVIRNDVEKATGGFDFGPQGDITEDAFWAVKGMQSGLRSAWVEGYLEEQSCMSLMDFLRQRRRWFQGLLKVSWHAPVKLRWRICLGFNTMLWGLAPFATMYTFGNLCYHVVINPIIALLACYSLGSFSTLYIVGLKANMDEHGVFDRRTRAMLTFLQIVLLPVYSTMESLAVLWAMLTPVKGFQVVKK
jgi:egghead protein (zeste-white 4 protein)